MGYKSQHQLSNLFDSGSIAPVFISSNQFVELKGVSKPVNKMSIVSKISKIIYIRLTNSTK